ncbi:MAG: hypothetical protein NZM38_06590 [Cytophagales bacterium]|nr:hypothetical protein [Cytophagales bacterium]MDW8384424.1 hypothetical protein [Flammeovirgaceae bacterium]
MSFFDKIIEKIFHSQAEGERISFTEPIKRQAHHVRAYNEWRHSKRFQQMLAEILDAYMIKKQKGDNNLSVHLYESPQANGWAITCSKFDYSPEEYRNFFDYLKEKVLALNYFLQFSERRMTDKGDFVETLEKYYLKPHIPLQDFQQPFHQLYGNITIDYIVVDDTPSYIKFLSTVYNDRYYNKPLPFDELVAYLFDANKTF